MIFIRSFLLASLGFVIANPNPPRIISPINPFDPINVTEDTSVLIIGGGIAGMSAALELGERGFKVTLKEASSRLGGRVEGFKCHPFKNATTFNVEHGFHAWFHNYFQFDDILTRLDVKDNFRPWEKVEYIFRDYKPESIYSEGPYPLNLLSMITRSENLKIYDTLGLIFALPDMSFYNYDKVYEMHDSVSLKEWAESKHVNKAFYDIIMDPAVSVTLNDRNISAAEMLTLMQIYFLNSPESDKRRVATKPYNIAFLNPWADRLRSLGVDIRTNSPVTGLEFVDGKAVNEIDHDEVYDYVILAADLGATQKILKNSIALDEVSQRALYSFTYPVNRLKIANPYKVCRIWFDKKLDSKYPDILETPQHSPINLVAQYHLLEEEYAEWSKKTGGSVIEFHLYDLSPSMENITDPETIWKWFKSTAYEIYPDLKTFKPIGFNLNSHHNFPSFEKGQHKLRPYTDTPSEKGLYNLAIAGDWVQTPFPSFIMERAVSTGRLAANFVLRDSNVREVPLKVISSNGPGIF